MLFGPVFAFCPDTLCCLWSLHFTLQNFTKSSDFPLHTFPWIFSVVWHQKTWWSLSALFSPTNIHLEYKPHYIFTVLFLVVLLPSMILFPGFSPGFSKRGSYDPMFIYTLGPVWQIWDRGREEWKCTILVKGILTNVPYSAGMRVC